MTSAMDKALRGLLAEHGYELAGTVVIQKGVPGFSSDRVFFRARTLFDACERLIPIIHRDSFHDGYITITEPAAAAGR